MAWIRRGRYWKAPRFGWYVNFTERLDGSWIEMENVHDWWHLTERGAKRHVRRLEAAV